MAFPLSVYEPSGLVKSVRFCSVMKNPGAIAFTLKFSPNFIANSPAIYLVKLVTAAFAAPYPTTRERGLRAASDEILMIFPCLFLTMILAKITVGITVPIRFKSTTLRKSFIFKSKIVPSGLMIAPGIFPPAAFISTSTRSYFATMSFAFCSSISSLVTSVCKKMASPPLDLTRLISSSPFCLLRARTAIFAPWAARYSTIDDPRTPVPPVITITLS